MTFCVASASCEAWVAWVAWLAPADGTAGPCASTGPLAGVPLLADEELGELAEQPASSSAAPEISAALQSTVVRSGPRWRTGGVVFMPLGRAPFAAGSARDATVR